MIRPPRPLDRQARFAIGTGAGRLVPVIIAAALSALALPVAAQVDTGTIEVITRDETGLPMAGVKVTVVNSRSGLQRLGASDLLGRFIVPALPPDSYTVRVEAENFAPAQQDLGIRIGQTAKLIFIMRVQVSETITVTGERPLVDVLKTDSSTNVTPEQIEQLPVPSRLFERLAFIAPGTYRERGPYRGIQNSPVVGADGNASHTTFMVDGVDLTDQTNGLSRVRIAQDAIQEFRVVTARFDAEIGGSQGGAISVVTKSGGNELHGGVFGFYRSADLRATGALEEGSEKFSRYQLGFTLGGPIIRDRTHYFLSLEHIDEEDVALFRPGGAFVDLATDYPRPTVQTLALGSLDLSFGTSETGFAKLAYERLRSENNKVGGVADESTGTQRIGDRWNLILGLTKVFAGGNTLNEARLQVGQRSYDDPPNSSDMQQWFSNGATLQIGGNTFGHHTEDNQAFELRDTFHWQSAGGKDTHDFKFGVAWMHVRESAVLPLYGNGQLVWTTDAPVLPFAYVYGVGDPGGSHETDILSAFFNDVWRPAPNLSLSLGIRYDFDTQGNNPDFDDSPLVGPRQADADNLQPRVGFSWDLNSDGKNILRGGAGVFTGRYLMGLAMFELGANGTTGWVYYRNLNGLLYGLGPEWWLDPADLENTGVQLPPNILLLQDSLEAPETFQASLGFTRAVGSTGLYLDIEGIYAKGRNETTARNANWNGNDDPTRPNPEWDAIMEYSDVGRSEYFAAIVGLNGTFGRGHLVTSSLAWAHKKNISDDFSPVLTSGYPSDSADIENEWGRSQGTEEWRFVLSGVFRLPARFTVGTTYIYGTGQPWNRLIGYDYNGDGFYSDRLEGVPRNGEDGPRFSQLNLRLTWTLPIGAGAIDFIAEAFNLFNTTNYDVNSIDNSEFLGGPNVANPDIPYTENPNFGEYRATLDPLEVQLGIRWSF